MYKLICLLLSISITYPSLAQAIFNEGRLKYDITIDPPANQEGITQYSGSYIITVKGKQIKQELKLNNGFIYTSIYNYQDNTAYILRKFGETLYAIQLNMSDVQTRRKRYKDNIITEGASYPNVATLPAYKGSVSYTDGTSLELVYSKEMYVNETIFDRLPALKVLPLIFTTANDDGLTTRFKANAIVQEPVENSEFRISSEYKMISYEEYQKLRGK